MAVEKNLLLTSLSTNGDRKTHHYFYYKDKAGYRYCDGLSVAEAGAKYILSEVPLDEIIVLGAENTFQSGEENNRIVLREYSDFVADTDMMSEYCFFQYRISQFLDNLDLESIDVLNELNPDRVSILVERLQMYKSEISGIPGFRPDRLFHLISQDPALFEKLKEYENGFSKKEKLWLKRYIYNQLSPNLKLSVREDNESIRICFIPTDRTAEGKPSIAADNVGQIVQKISEIEANVINLYIDMQGLETAEGYTILAVLSMLSNDRNNKIHIKEIITSHNRPNDFAGVIDNQEMERYDINNLVSGMSAFIRYGKVDEIQSYWDSRGIQDDHVDLLLYAMRRVDEGISLCNISNLEFGINLLKEALNNTAKEEMPEVVSNIFRILEETIRLDYGALLEGETLDELELVKWAMRKKFYQQSLTIIESRLPKDMLDRGILCYADSAEAKQAYLEELNRLYWSYQPKDRWNFNDIPHFFVKYYGRQQLDRRKKRDNDKQKNFTKYRIESLDGQAENILKGYSVLNEDRSTLSDLLFTYYALGDIRNHINHAEDQKEDIKQIDIHAQTENIKLLTEGVANFIEAFEKGRARALELHPEPVETWQISQAELKAYTAKHQISPQNNQNRSRQGKYPQKQGFHNQNHRHERSNGDTGNEKNKKSDSQILRITVNIEG